MMDNLQEFFNMDVCHKCESVHYLYLGDEFLEPALYYLVEPRVKRMSQVAPVLVKFRFCND